MHRAIRLIAALSCVATLAAACSDSGTVATTATLVLPRTGAAPVGIESLRVDPTTESRCDPLGARCLLPWPNDHFTVADPATVTHRRLRLDPASTPTNAAGTHIDVADQNRSDGWSPGSTLMLEIPGLAVTGLPAITDPARSLADDAPVVVLDTTTGHRHPYWAELDANSDPGTAPLLLIHPAKNFDDGHHIVVGVRHVVDGAGHPIRPTPAFAAYRDGQRTTDRAFEQRRPDMEATFAALTRVGVDRAELQLAWDFTIASTASLTGRMLAMRDDAFGQLGDAAPSFTVDQVTESPRPTVRREVRGTFEVPDYLTEGGAPGSRLVLDDLGVPRRQATPFTAHYTCVLPDVARSEPARMALYGHGLLGDQSEVTGRLTTKMAATYDIAYCATDWYGMSENDVGTALGALSDLSMFARLPDRLQEGLLAFLFLGRLMKHPDGFSSNPAFRIDGRQALKTDELYLDGNSQGAILGGALTAVAQDFTRSALGEAGMNYHLLLDRSVDFDEYALVLKPAYPARFDRIMGLAIVQLLWDRGETDGYANHVTADPLPHTPRHTVLLYGAVGDHQVTEYSLRVEAATMGAAAHEPMAAPGRVAGADPGWLLPTLDDAHRSGSAYFLWDTGSPASPLTNTPSRDGHDPHDDTPSIPQLQKLKDGFWHPHGTVTDVCGGAPCVVPVPPENAD